MTLGAIRAGITCAFALCLVPVSPAAELKQSTLDAFQSYVARTEAARAERLRAGRPFLSMDDFPDKMRLVKQGGVAVMPCGAGEQTVRDGLIHHWMATVFIAGATLDRALAVAHDYNNHKFIFSPDVVDSRLVSQNGNEYRTAVRLLRSKLVTLVLDADYDVRYVPVDSHRWSSSSRSVRIREVEGAGTTRERDLPDGKGRGFLWRLYTYSRYEERDGGVYIECEAISLSRGYPFGLAWVIRPMVRDLPGEALTKMLSTTRQAVLAVESGRLRPRPVAAP